MLFPPKWLKFQWIPLRTLYSFPECQGTPCSKQAPYLKLRTKWLWVRISLLSLKLQIWCLLWARRSVTFWQTTEYGSTLKLVRDLIITYRHIDSLSKSSFCRLFEMAVYESFFFSMIQSIVNSLMVLLWVFHWDSHLPMPLSAILRTSG